MQRLVYRYLRRPWEILVRTPLRWIRGRRLPSGTVACFYGYERIPGRRDFSGGGIIKLQDLVDEIPNAREASNLLYLISSAYPWTVRWQVLWARWCGAKVILNQNGVAYPGWYGPGYEEENRRARWVYERADWILFQSEFCRSSAATYLGPRSDRWETLHNPVDTSAFSPEPLASPPWRLVLAGSHQFRYRIETALGALALLRADGLDVRLVLAGRFTFDPDPERGAAEVAAMVAASGQAAAVELRGPYRQSEAPGLLRSGHLLLHPKYNDACPRLVAEALACGLPVVYSASGGTGELVGPDAGIGIPAPVSFEEDHPPSAEAIAAAVRRMLQTYPEFRDAARRRALDLLDRGPWLKRHRALMEELVR